MSTEHRDRRTWQPWEAVAEVFEGPADVEWDHDRDLIDADVQDPGDGR